MSNNRWTDEQLGAITARNKDTLVSAAAGSGKTAVLVERIIRRISTDNPTIDIDRMLVVTFTKAAASEMSQRIGVSLSKKVQALSEQIRQNPDLMELKTENIHLQNQITLLNRADIKTIHSFCLQVIKEYYHVIDIDPAFKTADPAEISLLQEEIMEEYFEELYETGNADFLNLLETYSEDTKDNRLKDMILKLVNFSNGFPNPFSALDKCADNYKTSSTDNSFNINHSKYITEIQTILSLEISQALNEIQQACDIVTEDTYNGIEKVDSIHSEYTAIKTLYDNINSTLDYENWYTLSHNIKFATLRGGSKDYKNDREEIKLHRDLAKKILTSIKEKYLCYDLDYQNMLMEQIYISISKLIDLTKGFMTRFSNAKKSRTIIDFNDYEHFAFKILVHPDSTLENVIPTPYAKEIQTRYDEIMIDEYQDSNLVQEMVLSAVSTGSNRFIVGDIKQSIYSFRLAMPELFAGKLSNTTVDNHKILLTRNFRSRANVLYGINFIFSQIMTIDFGDVAYDDTVALYTPDNAKAIYPDPEDGTHIDFQNDLILIEHTDNIASTANTDDEDKETSDYISDDILPIDNANSITEDIDKYELEISAIVTKINELMANKTNIYDPELKAYRPLAYSDIAIITRSIKNLRSAVETIFTREGIPYYIESSLSYFDVLEVDTILNLLRVVDNPIQDIPLIAILRSPIYMLTSEELLKIRIHNNKGNFYECIISYINYTPTEDNSQKNIDICPIICEKIHKLLNDISMYRKLSKELSLFELISHILDYTGYFDYVGIGDCGNLRQGNLQLLLQKAKIYESGSYQGLFYFIRYIEELKISTDNESSAKDESNIGKALHVTTIHKSKGLEFPVVFVAMCGKEINFMDTRNNMVFHREYGVSAKYMDLNIRGIYTPFTQPLISNAIINDTFSEEVRILYVALTRAREKLIIVGCVKNIEKSLAKWETLASNNDLQLPTSKLRKTKTYLDFIVPALLRHPDISNFSGKLPLNFKACGNPLMSMSNLPYWQISTWSIYNYTRQEVLQPFETQKATLLTKEETLNELDNIEIDTDYLADVEKLFKWEYAYNNSTFIQGKTTISEMKRKFMEDEDNSTKDYFEDTALEFPKDELDNKTIARNVAGTILHKVMELIDFKRDYNEADIIKFITQLVDKKIISELESKSINTKELSDFFNSNIYKRMSKSNNIEKEHVFSMLLSPQEAFVGEDNIDYGDDKILVNGMIDCYFESDGEVFLLDYKSDKLKSADEFIKRYAIQLKMYRVALEKALDKKVDNIVIYSFKLSQEIYID